MGVIIPYTLHSLQRLVRCDGAGLIFLHVVIFFFSGFLSAESGDEQPQPHLDHTQRSSNPASGPAGNHTAVLCFAVRACLGALGVGGSGCGARVGGSKRHSKVGGAAVAPLPSCAAPAARWLHPCPSGNGAGSCMCAVEGGGHGGDRGAFLCVGAGADR